MKNDEKQYQAGIEYEKALVSFCVSPPVFLKYKDASTRFFIDYRQRDKNGQWFLPIIGVALDLLNGLEERLLASKHA